MRYLGLDLGKRRTGVAFADSNDDIMFSLETISGKTEDELVEHIQNLISEKSIEELVIGLPLLPSGERGSQADWAQLMIDKLQALGTPISLIDERYTTGKLTEVDQDAAAACKILSIKLDQNADIDS
jgi:putative Holliday junction resolvase